MANQVEKNEGGSGVVATFVVPYCALVVAHVVFSWVNWQPTVFFDELGYLGNARFLAGAGGLPNLQGFTFYHFGYSALIAPAFWLSADPTTVYKAVVVINGLLLSGLYFCFYYVLRRLFEYPARLSSLVAFVGSLYPAYLLQSGMAWSESGLILFYGLLIASFGALLKRQTFGAAVLFGVVAAYCYAIHPRALPLLPVSFLAVAALAARGRLPKMQSLVALASMGVAYALVRAVNGYLEAQGGAGAEALGARSLLAQLLAPTGTKNLVIAAAGQLLYLCQASYGLFALGVLEGARQVWARRGGGLWGWLDDPKAAVIVFLFLTSLGILFASSLVMVGAIPDPASDDPLDPVRGDHLIYGRYNESFLGLYVILGLASLHAAASERQWSSRQIGAVVAAIAVLTLGVLGAGGYRFLDRNYVALTIWGVYPMIRPVQELSPAGLGGLVQRGVLLAQKEVLGVVSLASLAVFLVLVRLAARRYRTAVCLVGVLFVLGAAYGYYHFMRPAQINLRATRLLPDRVRRLEGVRRVCYDMSRLNWQAYGGYQYFLPGVAFEQFWSDKGEVPSPSCQVVISGTDWKDADRLGARLVFAEKSRNNALWVLPGDLQARLPPVGPFLNVNVGCERVAGVLQSGFDRDGMNPEGPVRWTKGAAKLTVPLDCPNKPRSLHVALAAVGPQGTRFRLLLNGKELCDEFIKGPWDWTFDLTGLDPCGPTTLELLSDTFRTTHGSVTGEPRVLGVLVRDITFRDQ
jgi:hypothetical protein